MFGHMVRIIPEDQTRYHIPLSQLTWRSQGASFPTCRNKKRDQQRRCLWPVEVSSTGLSTAVTYTASILVAKLRVLRTRQPLNSPTRSRQSLSMATTHPSLSSVWVRQGFFGSVCQHALSSEKRYMYQGSKLPKTALCSSWAQGVFKLKPMLVCHSETSRAMEGFSKGHMHVIWKWNKRAGVTIDNLATVVCLKFLPNSEVLLGNK